MFPLPFLTAGLLSIPQSPVRIDPPPSRETRKQIPTARQELEAELAKLPLAELLQQQPNNPWDRDNPGHLLPVVMEMCHRAQSGTLTDDDWRTALTLTDMIHTRPQWPVGVPLQVGIRHQVWLPRTEITVRAVEPPLGEVSLKDCKPAMCGNEIESRYDQALHLRMAQLPPDTTRVIFEVTVLQFDYGEDARPKGNGSHLLWRGQVERPLRGVATVADVVSVSEKESDAELIRKCLGTSLSRDPGELLSISFYGSHANHPALQGLGVSLTIDLWDVTHCVRTVNLVAYCRKSFFNGMETGGSEFITDLPEELRAPDADLSKWELRIRANPSEIPGIWDADRWWNGSFSVSLAEAMAKRFD